MVAPPRQLAWTRRMNSRWIGRQLRRLLPNLEEAVAWVRWPTPEVVAALEADRPAFVIYECVDPYEVSPGVRGTWAPIFAEAERRLIAMADLVVTPAEALGDRLRESASRVVVIPHGVDTELFSIREQRPERSGIEIGFAGTLDYRLDTEALIALATADPSWRLRLVGPVHEGFEPGVFERFPNVTVEGPVPHELVGEIVAGFDVGILPYVLEAPHYLYEYTDPIKASELLAAGRPIVARRNRALDRLASGIYFADSPSEFVAQVRRALAEDGSERSRARRALIATDGTWEARLRQLVDVVDELTAPQRRPAYTS
jgi:glycosyltransferase involved in cell wall biosynthesis